MKQYPFQLQTPEEGRPLQMRQNSLSLQAVKEEQRLQRLTNKNINSSQRN
jgi:hypothetical protein